MIHDKNVMCHDSPMERHCYRNRENLAPHVALSSVQACIFVIFAIFYASPVVNHSRMIAVDSILNRSIDVEMELSIVVYLQNVVEELELVYLSICDVVRMEFVVERL